MSEENPEPQAPANETEPQKPEGDKPLGEGGEKALTAERAARKAAEKAAAELKAQLDAIEAASLSELEKAQRSAKDAQDQLAAITRQNTRNTVALTKGVPADLVDFLTGDTEDEMSAKADVLLARLGAPTTPLPDPTQGAKGDPPPRTNADKFAEAVRDII